MWWKLLLALLSFFRPGQDITPEIPLGPQSESEIAQAYDALHGDHYGGDMLNDIGDAGIKDTKYRWPGYPGKATIPYVVDRSLAGIQGKIEQAMQQYAKLTCIRFVPRKNEKDYIRLVQGRGCSSYVGRIGGGQPVNLGRGCEYVGTIVHELGHALGLYHEHQRSDRDTYVTIYKNNVTAGQFHNFDRSNPSAELIYTPYDYSSIMHYGNYAFSKQPKVLMTMEAKNKQKLLEPFDKPGLTNSDITLIKKLYKC